MPQPRNRHDRTGAAPYRARYVPVQQQRRHPELDARVITDPINTLYGALMLERLAAQSAGPGPDHTLRILSEAAIRDALHSPWATSPTSFVRAHMLESFNVQPRIDGLLHHFDDLSRAHEAVLKARAQVEALTPLVADCDRHEESAQQRQRWESYRDTLKAYFARHKGRLLEQRLTNLEAEYDRQRRTLAQQGEVLSQQRGQRDQLKDAISKQGGDRLEQLASEIDRLDQERERRQQRANDYARHAASLDLARQPDLDTFSRNLHTLATRKDALESESARLDNEQTELTVTRREYRKQHDERGTEIASLRQRRSNIHSRQIGIRDALCDALKLEANDLPFAGELVRVREQETAWEGAAERVLHNFSLSLLVPDNHYTAVADWVEKTNLRGRLVYFRVRQQHPTEPPELQPSSLVHKLDIRPDSEFYPWMEQSLARRFDYACCDDLSQFRRESRAITPAGQIKAGDQRHEKDDRHSLNDRSRFVLGWSNEQKIANWLTTLTEGITVDVSTYLRMKVRLMSYELRENIA